MGILDFFESHRGHHEELDQVESGHKAQLSHELIAGAAAYEAAKAYEKHCREQGKPTSHAQAKELLAGFSAAFIDRMVETKGLDYIDQKRAKALAEKHAHDSLAESGEY